MALSVDQLVRRSRPRPIHLSLASRGEVNLAKPFGRVTPDVVSEICRRVRIRVEERGLCAVFSGDISSVLFRLQPSQDSLFHDWFSSVSDNMAALRSGVSPQTLVKFLRRIGCFYVLTVKVIFVHLSYVVSTWWTPLVLNSWEKTTGRTGIGAVQWRNLLGSDEVRCGARQAHGVQRGGDQVAPASSKDTRSNVCGRRATLATAQAERTPQDDGVVLA